MPEARDIESIKADITRLIEEARQAGHTEGYADAIRNIIAAATAAVSTAVPPSGPGLATPAPTPVSGFRLATPGPQEA
jgi:hypothetical protein